MTSKFTAQLKEKLDSEKAAVTSYTKDVSLHSSNELKKLGKDLANESKNVVNSISSDMEQRLSEHNNGLDKIDERMRQIEKRQSKPFVWTGLGCLCLALLSGLMIWGLSIWNRSELESISAERKQLKAEIATLEISKLKLDDWGITLRKETSGRYVILPRGKEWELGDWKAKDGRVAGKIGE